KSFDQDRNGGGFIGLVGDCLLAEYEATGGREGRDEMERRLVGAAVVASTRGLAINGDEVQAVGPRLPHPGRESSRKQRWVDAIHQDGEPPGARNTVMIGQEATQKRQMRFAPC